MPSLHVLLDTQLSGLLLDVHSGHRGQCEIHIAGRAGSPPLGIEEGQRMGPRLAGRQIIPQIHIFPHRRVDTADIADKAVIQEYPHVIVSEEAVFQRAYVIFRQAEGYGILQAKEAVMRPPVIADGEGASVLLPGARGIGIAQIGNALPGCAKAGVRFVAPSSGQKSLVRIFP